MLERFLIEIWTIVLALGPPLLLGIAMAGIIHVILPVGFVHRNFGARGLPSIVKATLIGVPMPLCSCSVIPTAIGLRQDGASEGAATGFLISTPQTGIDSILVSASFLGWPFAIFKLAAAFVTGIIGGKIVDLTDKKTPAQKAAHKSPVLKSGYKPRLIEAFRFGVIELLGMIYGWIILGILIAALITMVIPPGTLSSITWISGLGGMLLMLLISLPLYVCATASVPIAASLIIAGMPVGTALVFLMAGPASNIATVGAILRAFGGRVLSIYLATVAILSIIFGLIFDSIIDPGQVADFHQHPEGGWFPLTAAIVLISLFVFLSIRDLKKRFRKKYTSEEIEEMKIALKIKGMTCQHCATNVTRALESVPGVNSAKVNLEDNLAVIDGDADIARLIDSVGKAGYTASIKSE